MTEVEANENKGQPVRLSLEITPDAMGELNKWMNMLYLTGGLNRNAADPATLMCGHILAAVSRSEQSVVIDMGKVKQFMPNDPRRVRQLVCPACRGRCGTLSDWTFSPCKTCSGNGFLVMPNDPRSAAAK